MSTVESSHDITSPVAGSFSAICREFDSTMGRIGSVITKYEDLAWYYKNKRSESLSNVFKKDIDDIERKYPDECEDILERPDIDFHIGCLAGLRLAKDMIEHVVSGNSSQSLDELFDRFPNTIV